MSIDIKERVDVVVSLGTQPISTASFDSAMFLVETSDVPVGFVEAYRVYTSLAGMVSDGFDETDSAYKFAALCFGGNFPAKSVYVVKYETGVLTPTAAFNAQLLVDGSAYYVSCDDHTAAIITPLVAAAEAAYKMVVLSSQEAGILVPATDTDIGSVLQDAAYDHVITLYSEAADTSLADGGIVGAMAAIQAGVSTLEDKTLTGVTASANLTETQITALKAKNVAYYAPIAGVNSLFNSKVASGQWFDTIVFSDWLRARIGESIYGTMKRESDSGRKIAYNSKGKLKIEQAIQNVILNGIANGSISDDTPYTIRIPTNAEILEADRLARVLPDVVVEVPYSSAVHKVMVRVYVSV